MPTSDSNSASNTNQIDQPDIVIEACFRGPPQSGNGGYVGGIFSRVIDASGEGNVEVTLRSPIPLDKGLQAIKYEDGSARIMDGDVLIAEVKPANLTLDVPQMPDWSEVEAAADKSFSFTENINELIPGRKGFHPICFCCGAEHEWGMRVFAAPIKGGVAAIWPTSADWDMDDGLIKPEYLWTAMDCPGQFAYMAEGIRTGMLGRITARIYERPKAGETLMVMAWPIAVEGKKHFAGSVIFDKSGKKYSEAITLWIGRQ